MRANAILFWILAVFFLLSAVVYTLWSLLDPMHQKVEWVGTVALLLSAILAAFMITLSIGFVVATAKREPVLRYLESDPREIAADTRVTLWATTLEAWQAYPIFGSGLGTFREAYRPHQPREIPQLVEQAHSDPLQILVTGGALGFLLPRLEKLLGASRVRYAARPESASPATGSHKAHIIEQRRLLDSAFAAGKSH